MKSQARTTILSILLLAALAGCDRHRGSLRIGGLAPLSGEVSSFGASSRNGYELAVQEWNARGGLLGKPIQLILGDDQGDPAEGMDVLTRLIERDRIVALLGASTSKVSFVAAPLAQAARIPMISPTSSDPKLTEIGDYIFRACCTDFTQGAAGATFAFKDLKARKAACIFDTGNPFTLGLARIFRDRFTHLGGRIVAFEGHATRTTNFKPQLTKALQAGAEVLYLPDYYQDASLIAREARAIGFRGTLVGADGWDSPQLALAASRGLDSGFFTADFARDEDRPLVKAFVRNYQDRFQVLPDAFAALAYDAGNILFDAIQRAGTTDGPALRAALAQTRCSGVSGPISFDARRNPVKAPIIIEIKGGLRLYRGRVEL